MACCFPSHPVSERSRAIDKLLKQQGAEARKELKLLLLGTGECGKSTIIKQMRIIHGTGYSEAERRDFVALIHQNLILAMKAMLDALPALGLALEDDALKEPAADFLASVRDMLERAPVPLFKRLWKDAGLQAAYRRRREYQLNDSTAYFMDALGRIESKSFTPNEQDVLRARTATTGIIEYAFNLHKVIFRMVDVGGQRSQRHKWIHCFEGVTSLVFVAALSEYDQTLAEASATNRMVESLNLFKYITRDRFFRNSSVILFLNKRDLLLEKLATSAVATYFPQYTGAPADAKAVEGFFLSLFVQERADVYPHFTCATDTNNMKFVFSSVEETLTRSHLEDYNMV